jgi:two-component system phosphate regulon sensor histidine kinase PhoR
MAGPPVKIGAAVAVAAGGTAGAIWAGAPPAAALLALLAGIAAYALAPGGEPEGKARPEDEPQSSAPGQGALIDAIEEPLIVVEGRRVAIANRAAKALLGDHIEGSDLRLAIRHPAAAERLGEAADAPARTELIGLGDMGRPWEMTVAPLPDGSRLVRLADQSRARAAEQIRVDFVANASHELRTPLATLIGFIETLQDEAAVDDKATRERFLGIMSGEAKRMRDLLDDLMSLSRIEADRFALPQDSVLLAPLIDQVTSALEPMAEGRALLIENEARDAAVTGDRGQLGQMLNNLIVNALKYGRAGTPVKIRTERAENGLLRIAVSDEGEGIAAEHIPRLTERFYRVDPGRSRQVGGTGLGLAIVKHIVLRHRGKIDIASEPGKGTCVTVHLAQAQPERPPVIKESLSGHKSLSDET